VTGNGNVKYTATLVKREHLTDPSKYGVAMNSADNRIVVSTGTACAFERMYNAAKAAGVNLLISSAFRTLGRQTYFYNCMINKNCNGGNTAAKPGTSNHGQGLALDLNTDCGKQGTRSAPLAHPPAACKSSKVYRWLYSNGPTYGFVRRVQDEPWHFEYRPGQKQPAYAW
jgi:LAS superfamily LD-carboxypeptidase LdcB